MPWWLIDALIFFAGVSAGWNLQRWNSPHDPRLGQYRISRGTHMNVIHLDTKQTTRIPSFIVERFEKPWIGKPRWKQLGVDFANESLAKDFKARLVESDERLLRSVELP